MRSSDVRLSRFVSLVLRHDPSAAGLALDPHGWASVDALLAGAQDRGVPLTPEALERVVRDNDKRRFELSYDGARIRARQGHSVAVDLGLQPAVPPATLYHGTVAAALPAIRREGLRPMSRQHVHLSPDRESAKRVGSRRGAPVLLEVDAASLHARGVAFFLSTNGVWLTDAVPPEAVRFPSGPLAEA